MLEPEGVDASSLACVCSVLVFVVSVLENKIVCLNYYVDFTSSQCNIPTLQCYCYNITYNKLFNQTLHIPAKTVLNGGKFEHHKPVSMFK